MDLQELGSCLVLRAVRVLCHAVPRQGVHGQLIQGPTGGRRPLQASHRRVLPRRLSGVRTGVGRSSPIAKAGYPGVGRGGGQRADELAPGSPADLFVPLNVDVDGKYGHCLSHNERQGTEVEGPAVGVGVLLVVVTLVVGVAGIAGDVDDDADDVAQT